MQVNALTVGELAQQTGLTVRTLHYYDEIGLLKPSLHTEAGYRVYTPGDLGRLQQVLLLRQLGFSLAEIRRCMDDPNFSPPEVIRLHVAHLREQMELQHGLCERLETMLAQLRTAGEVRTDEYLRTIKVIILMENRHTPEQKEYVDKRRASVGEDRIRQVPAE